MNLDYSTLSTLRKNHPAWRLLTVDHAPMIAAFLNRVFIVPNVRVMAQADLVSALEDELHNVRESGDARLFPRSASQYIEEWARDDRGWLRKFYPEGSDEPCYDLTPATEKAIAWIDSLTQRVFVGTESRLMIIFDLLRQMVEGAETNADARIADLEKRKEELQRQIDRLRSGEVEMMDDTALKDRFQQVGATARELLGDFREVEQNFRQLDRRVREQIAVWEGRKGELLENIFGDRDAIADSDQGKSFRAFWDFLMSPEKQEELSGLLEKVFGLEPVKAMRADARLKRIHYDWLEAGEHTQRMVARLSQQLRRFLDDQTYLENRRIIQILKSIEAGALIVRDAMPAGPFMNIDDPSPDIRLPMERLLFSMPLKSRITGIVTKGDEDTVISDALYNQQYVDKELLQSNIRRMLQERTQVTLREVVSENPIKQGLSEVVGYLGIAGADSNNLFDENEPDTLSWQAEEGTERRATLPRVIFNR